MRSVLVAVTVALATAGTAAAHVEVSPGLLESGSEVELRVELPELRPDVAPTGLDVAGEGVRQLSTRPAGRVGEETRWRVRVLVTASPGPTTLRLQARFADGRSVVVRRTVTVVPPPGSGDDGAPVTAVAAGLVGLGAVLGAAVLLRRRAAAP